MTNALQVLVVKGWPHRERAPLIKKVRRVSKRTEHEAPVLPMQPLGLDASLAAAQHAYEASIKKRRLDEEPSED